MAVPVDSPAGGGGGLRRAFGVVSDLLDDLSRRLLTPERLHRISGLRIARPIARHSARAVFDVVAGFTHSQVLVACTRLGLLERLIERPATPAELAPGTGLDPDRMRLLCDAATAIGVLHRRLDGSYSTTIAGRAIQGDPGIQAMIEHNQLLYRDLVDPLALLRGDADRSRELADFWPYDGGAERGALESEAAERYSRLMAASQSFIAHEVLGAVDFSSRRRLLDVGGGTGAFVEAVGRAHPSLELGLADLPPVAAAAEQRLADAGLGGRVRCTGVDFFADPLPGDAEVITLVRILHDHDDPEALALLRAVRRALPDDGELVIAEPMRGEPSAERIGDVYFPLYFLAMGRGRSRSRAELEALCRAAGFEDFSRPSTHVPLQTSVLVARGGAATPSQAPVSGAVDERSNGIG